jgi:hypothetical protein
MRFWRSSPRDRTQRGALGGRLVQDTGRRTALPCVVGWVDDEVFWWT